MDGWSGREAKAVMAVKQIHRWGKGGHAYEEAAFNATWQKYFELWAELKPETMYSTVDGVCPSHCVVLKYLIILYMDKGVHIQRQDWMNVWMHSSSGPWVNPVAPSPSLTIQFESWHDCFWLPFFISVGPWMHHNSPTLGPGSLMETSPHASPMRPSVLRRRGGGKRCVCVCACFHVCFDGVKILGQALNAAPLIWGDEGWGVGEAPHRHTHNRWDDPMCIYLLSSALSTWTHRSTLHVQ